MADGKSYGINFPFRDSFIGQYLDTSDYPAEELRTDLIHLLLTRKGSRYYLPDFGTRLLEYIFEPLDGPTFSDIEGEIRDSISKYIPQLLINSITITPASEDTEQALAVNNPELDARVFRVPGQNTVEYTAKVRIDYTITNEAFETRDFIILNI